MVPIAGIGPATSPLPRECSATEPNGHSNLQLQANKTQIFSRVERGRRIELLALAWKAKVLPLYEPRNDAATGGEGWIRTSVLVRGQIYSLLPLTTRPPLQT